MVQFRYFSPSCTQPSWSQDWVAATSLYPGGDEVQICLHSIMDSKTANVEIQIKNCEFSFLGLEKIAFFVIFFVNFVLVCII